MKIGQKVKVRNMINSSGNAVKNQFIIDTDEGTYFQSYDSIIAYRPKGSTKIYLGQDWEYSVTTGKYRNQFLGIDKAETLQRIKAGTIIVTDLD